MVARTTFMYRFVFCEYFQAQSAHALTKLEAILEKTIQIPCARVRLSNLSIRSPISAFTAIRILDSKRLQSNGNPVRLAQPLAGRLMATEYLSWSRCSDVTFVTWPRMLSVGSSLARRRLIAERRFDRITKNKVSLKIIDDAFQGDICSS